MMGFGASEVVPVYFVIFTMATVTAGMVQPRPSEEGTTQKGFNDFYLKVKARIWP